MPDVAMPKQVTWKLPLLIVLLLLIAIAVAALINNSASVDDATVRPEGSAVLVQSGRILESPEGYEFLTQKATPGFDAADYVFNKAEGAKSSLPDKVTIREYKSTLAQDLEKLGVTVEDNVEAGTSYSEVTEAELSVLGPYSDYSASVDEIDNGFTIAQTYKREVFEGTSLYTRHYVVGGRDLPRTDIIASSAVELNSEFFELFEDQLN